MPWKVQSSVSGGMSLTAAQSEAYCSVSRKLSNLAHEMSMLSASWQHAAMVISNQTSAFNNLSASYNPSSPFTMNASQSFLTPSICNAYASKCQNMSQNLEQLAALIVRASGIYEDAEQKAKEQFDNGIALLTTIFPITSLPFLFQHSLQLLTMLITTQVLKMLENGLTKLEKFSKELFEDFLKIY